MEGILSLYDPASRLSYFESGPIKSTSCCVIIGGLTSGFLTLPYYEKVSTTLAEIGWSTVQFQLSSSYKGFGYGSLNSDAQEIASLLGHLVRSCGKKKILLLGHSTGCQDVLWYFNNYFKDNHKVAAAILLAPVSDREFFPTILPNWQEVLEWAKEKCDKGKRNTMYPEMIMGAPFTAYRLKSLMNRMDDDDFFTSDLTDEERLKKFGKLPIQTFVFFGEEEQYVKGGKEGLTKMGEAFTRASPNIKIMPFIPKGDHCISNPEAEASFCNSVKELIEKYLS